MRVTMLMIALLLAGGARPAMSAPPVELGPIEGKVVWVDFWASWCAPCRRSFPWMNQMQARYGKHGLQIIAVNLDSDRADAEQFLEHNPARFGVKFDAEGHLARTYDVQAMPSSYLLDASGNILQRHFGFKLADRQEYEAGIKAALAANP